MKARRPLAQPALRRDPDTRAAAEGPRVPGDPGELLFEGLNPSPTARARRSPGPERLAALLGRRALFWSPVALLLALLAQTVLGGLAPARAEARRLERAEDALTGRLTEAEELFSGYELRLRAFRDPVYLERERRLMAARDMAARDTAREDAGR